MHAIAVITILLSNRVSTYILAKYTEHNRRVTVTCRVAPWTMDMWRTHTHTHHTQILIRIWKPNESSDDMQNFWIDCRTHWCRSWYALHLTIAACTNVPSQFPNEWIRPISESEFVPFFSQLLLHHHHHHRSRFYFVIIYRALTLECVCLTACAYVNLSLEWLDSILNDLALSFSAMRHIYAKNSSSQRKSDRMRKTILERAREYERKRKVDL